MVMLHLYHYHVVEHMVIAIKLFTKLEVSHLKKKAVQAYADQEEEHTMVSLQNTTAVQQTTAIYHQPLHQTNT